MRWHKRYYQSQRFDWLNRKITWVALSNQKAASAAATHHLATWRCVALPCCESQLANYTGQIPARRTKLSRSQVPCADQKAHHLLHPRLSLQLELAPRQRMNSHAEKTCLRDPASFGPKSGHRALEAWVKDQAGLSSSAITEVLLDEANIPAWLEKVSVGRADLEELDVRSAADPVTLRRPADRR